MTAGCRVMRDIILYSRFIISIGIIGLLRVDASHFRGGLVSWRSVGSIDTTSSVSLEITQRYGWRRDYSEDTNCDDSAITAHRLMGANGVFVCQTGCRGIGNLGSVQIYCTDFSSLEDWMVGESTYTVSVPYVPFFEASFSSSAWINSLVIGGGGSWEVRAKFDFNATLSKRNGNTSPKSKMSPIINLLYGCNHTITIPVEDADGDNIRCRWAQWSLGECGDVCHAFPNAIVNERECTISYSTTGQVGLYAVAIQIEDFYSPLDLVPFSSSPLQFLVNVYQSTSTNISCYSKPTFVYPTRRDGACVGIPLNSTFDDIIIAQSGGSDVTILDLTTQSPVGLRKSILGSGPGNNDWYVNITWTPDDVQIGNNIFCYVAVDSTGASSDQTCISFAVGTNPPTVKPSSLFPTGTILPDNSKWQLTFDRSFLRPIRSSFIRFKDSSGTEIYSIDTATNPDVSFPNSSAYAVLSFQSRYVFTEKSTYFLTIDSGIAIGLEACGPESVGINDPFWWRITIKDITPPVLTFLANPSYSNGSIYIAWKYDEPAQSRCAVQTPSSLLTVACNNSIALANLVEGSFTAFIQSTDESGNSRQYTHSWYVDLTSPLTVISSKPALVSNATTSKFSQYCDDQSPCHLYCGVHDQGASPSYSSCSSEYLVSSLKDGIHIFSVYAVDIVGNVGATQSYTWTVDTVAPTISSIGNVTVFCGSPYDPSHTGLPVSSDNTDPSPSLSYADQAGANCITFRTWTAIDQAGNVAKVVQVITFANVISPSVHGSSDVYIPCSDTAELSSSEYAVQILNISSLCGRKINVTYIDSIPADQCGIAISRQWIVRDDCNSLVYFSQIIYIQQPSSPDFPDNGQVNVNLRSSLGWPTYPNAVGFNIYIWRFGTTQPLKPTAFVQIWRREYSPPTPFSPDTQYLWRIGYIVSVVNGTREIPGPTWGFETESFADLALFSVRVPQITFSGSSFTVTWTVNNIGNVSTSESTAIFYDRVYLSRTTLFSDSYIAATQYQQRYVDPQDGYVSNIDVSLQPSDIGKFYVFVVVDIYRYVRDYSFDNNQATAPQLITVKLTPPPNLKITSINTIGSAFSGQQFAVRYTVENAGLGITSASAWQDAIYLSTDSTRNSTDQLLLTVLHSGALASGSQYVTNVAITIPNAIYGEYFIIVTTDLYNNVFENTDENDNDIALKVTIVLSPYPDLVVSNISTVSTAYTGDTMTVSTVVKNVGFGSPFEYSWSDGLVITSTRDNIKYTSLQITFYGGPQLHPGQSYETDFLFKIPPSMPSGEYNVSITADVSNFVFEFQSKNNNNKNTLFQLVQQLPDLSVGQRSVAVISNITGNYLEYNVSIMNVGAGSVQIPFWENRILISSSLGTSDLISFTSYPPAISKATLNLSSQSIYVPIAYVGSFDIYILIDARNQIIESNKTNNYVKLGSISLIQRQTDLTIRSFYIPETASAGSVTVLQWEVENTGNIASGNWLSWFDEITIWNSMTSVELLSRELVTFPVSFPPGGRYVRRVNTTIPSNLAGVYNIAITTGQYTSEGEGQESNVTNSRKVTTLFVKTPPSPQFKLKSCSAVVTLVSNLRLLSVTCTITNVGNSMDVPIQWTDQVALINASGDAILTAYISVVRKLLAGDIYTDSTTIVIPPAIYGFYYLQLSIDVSKNISQRDIGNFQRVPQPINVQSGPSPILSVKFQPLQQSNLFGGDMITVNCTIYNSGQAGLPLSTWTDGLYLFQRNVATKLEIISSGFLISSIVQNNQIDIGGEYSVTLFGMIPYFLNSVVYIYVIPDINYRLPLIESGNATRVNTSVSITQGPLPDLTAVINQNGTVTVQSGQTFQVNFTVNNIGNSTTIGTWYDTIFLSEDRILDPFDIPLKSVLRPRQLRSGENYTQSGSFVVPYDLLGLTYYVLVVANVRKQCAEASLDNNVDSILVNIEVLPAVDIFVMAVSSSKLNATYYDPVVFSWSVANNGSIASMGRKCDSVYLSSDDVWDITDVIVVNSQCGYFSLGPKGSILDTTLYSGSTIIPPLAEGQYLPFVRTRSNVKDFNLTNNIGYSSFNLTVNPPTISLNENKSFSLNTNQYLSYKLTGLRPGIGIVVILTTNYQFAYHQLYIKQNSPPATNDYDSISKDSTTFTQRVSLTTTKSNSAYLLIQSSSAFSGATYMVYVYVKESKFEATAVFPSTVLSEATVTLKITGSLFVDNMRVSLSNSRQSVDATDIYRYISEEVYATFNTTSLNGSYALILHDDDNNLSFQLNNAVTITGMLIHGKLLLDIVTPGALRAGAHAIVQVQVGNTGYSDVVCPIIYFQTGEHSKLVSTEADIGSSLTNNIYIIFLPLERNRPPSMLPPGSFSVFSFEIIPIANFIGTEELDIGTLEANQLLQIIPNFKDQLESYVQSSDVWNFIWENTERCLGENPSLLINEVGGYFVQHYTSFYTLTDIISHIVEISGGEIPQVLMTSFFDVIDSIGSGTIGFGVERRYYQQLSTRRTSGLFGLGWTFPLLEISAEVSADSVILTKQRRLYVFTRTDTSTLVFKNPRLSGDQITMNRSTIIYQNTDVLYNMDSRTGLLQFISVKDGFEWVSLGYDANSKPVSMVHSSGSNISIDYGTNGFISSVQLYRAGARVSQVYYNYNSAGLLRTVSGQTVTNYEYTVDGDLITVTESNGRTTTFSYDENNFVAASSSYINNNLLLSVETTRHCNGQVDVTIFPLNMSSSFLYGFGGEIMKEISSGAVPIKYERDSAANTVTKIVGDDVKERISFDLKTYTLSTEESNGENIVVKMQNDGTINSVGDDHSPYYFGEYEGGKLTKLKYRDGTYNNLTYNSRGQTSLFSSRDGSTYLYNYDGYNRLSQITTSEGIKFYNYDDKGLLSEVVDSNGERTKLEYNVFSQPTSVVYPDGTRLDYTYNSCSQRSSIVSNTGYNATYLFDDFCRLSQVLDGTGTIVASYEYGSDSRLARKRLGNGMYTEYSYVDNSLRLRRLRNFSPNNTLLSSYVYTYDNNGYRVQMDSLEGKWTYAYDASGQLIAWTSPLSQSYYETFEYDSNKNRKWKRSQNSNDQYFINSMHQYTGYGQTQNFTYDKNGNLIQKSVTNGNTVTQYQFTYNADGRVSRTVINQTICEYRYTVFGSLSSKVCSDGTDISYTSDPFGVFGADILVQNTGQIQEYVYHGREHGLIASVQTNNLNALFYLFDGDGSTVQLGNGNGDPGNSYIYDPFGALLSDPLYRDNNTYKFMAQFGVQTLNGTAGIIFMRNRLYDAEHGRFCSPDPLGLFGSPQNPYCYANNNPVTYKDPTGQNPAIIAIVIGTAIGAVVGGFDYYLDTVIKREQFEWWNFTKATFGGAASGFIATSSAVLFEIAGVPTTFITGYFLVKHVMVGEMLNKIITGENPFTPENLFDLFLAGLLSLKNFGRVGINNKESAISLLKGARLGLIVDFAKKFINWIRSRDPNEISGPLGYGDGHYISTGQFLEYKIEFENDPNATAPAQLVAITCPLDQSLDLATFRVGAFAFGVSKLDAGFNSFSYQGIINATDETGTFVFVQAILDVVHSEARWIFQTLDPSTGLPPTNPLVGFLPPNNGTSGKGYVTFRIEVKESATTSTRIYENATIVFDENAPIDTPTIFHTIDKTPPTVSMNASNVPGGVLIQFQNTDDGSGVRSIDLFTVENEKTKLLMSGIVLPAVLVDLEANIEHTLTAVATDNVGNIGKLNLLNSVSVMVTVECPNNCSNRGVCGTSGICLCDSGYGGQNCSVDASLICEPPVIDLSYSNTTQNESSVIFLSATSPNMNGSLSMTVVCSPTDIRLSKGQPQSSGVYQLSQTDFGNIFLIIPDHFTGLVSCSIQAEFVGACGQSNRTTTLNLFVMPPLRDTTTFQFASSIFPNYTSTSPTATDRSVVSVVTTTAQSWSAWSSWSSCSRSCDSGVQRRQRQCILGTDGCQGSDIDFRICNLASCPGKPEETTEGAEICLSSADTSNLMSQLGTFLQLVMDSVNGFCARNTTTCCASVFGTFTALVQTIGNFTSISMVSLGAGFPKESACTPGGNYVLKVIVKVDKDTARSECVPVSSRNKRQTNLVFLDKTIIVDAILQNQQDIEKNLSVQLLKVATAEGGTNNPPTSSPPDNKQVIIAVVVSSVVLLIIIIVVGSIVLYKRRQKQSPGDDGNSSIVLSRLRSVFKVSSAPPSRHRDSSQNCSPIFPPVIRFNKDFNGSRSISVARLSRQ